MLLLYFSTTLDKNNVSDCTALYLEFSSPSAYICAIQINKI